MKNYSAIQKVVESEEFQRACLFDIWKTLDDVLGWHEFIGKAPADIKLSVARRFYSIGRYTCLATHLLRQAFPEGTDSDIIIRAVGDYARFIGCGGYCDLIVAYGWNHDLDKKVAERLVPNHLKDESERRHKVVSYMISYYRHEDEEKKRLQRESDVRLYGHVI